MPVRLVPMTAGSGPVIGLERPEIKRTTRIRGLLEQMLQEVVGGHGGAEVETLSHVTAKVL